MSQRKNPFVKMGRPKGPSMKAPSLSSGKGLGKMTMPKVPAAALGQSSPGPMDGFSPAVPGASFRRGGSSGYRNMPSHHDDPSFAKGGKVR